MPEFVWEEYWQDQEINDRGIGVDMEMVRNAIAMDGRSKAELSVAMKELTELENPNSVQQMKQWLLENGMETDSLDKKAVAELLKNAPEPLKTVLTLRQQLAKSSVKKYQAMENAVCADSRAHGMFQFYGANRTGRFCLTGDHEVLTDTGWQRLDKWTGGKIACWNPSGETVSFQKSNALVFPYEGIMYEYCDKRIDQISTPEHKMYVKRRYGGEWLIDTVENMEKYRPSIPFTGYRQTTAGLEHSILRVLVMVQADGCFTEDGSVVLAFTKLRKVERCKTLLRAADVSFVYREYGEKRRVRHQFKIYSRNVPLWLRIFRNKTFDTWLFDESADVFFDELVHWDGYQSAKNSIQYVTCNKKNADMVQALAHITGRAAQMKVKDRKDEHPNWSDAYVVDIWLTPKNCHEVKSKPRKFQYNGSVYCAETPTGFFLVRRNGRVWITGNSGRLVQLQNLPQNHIPDLAQARELVKAGDFNALSMLYEDIPDTLSQLIRTAFVPQDGRKFIVADFSAIEARVIAWIAGERWRIKVFEGGGDIYCASASQMFHVPVEKHGVNGHLRQKGKQAELACIAEGQPVLTDKGLIPIEAVTREHRLWDGENWVSHEGVVFKGEREVIEYEGLRATPDHLVWIEGQPEPVQFGIAASCGVHLIQTGDGGRAVRMGEDHQCGKTLEQGDEPLLCINKMHGVRGSAVAVPYKSPQRKIKGMPKLFTAEADTFVAGPTADSGKTEVRESKRSRIPQLRRPGDKIHVPKRERGGALFDKDVRAAKEGTGNRPHQQRQGLCSWESPVCHTFREQQQQTLHGPQPFLTGILALCKKRGDPQTLPGTDQGRNHSGCGNGSVRKTEKLAYHQCKARLYDIRNAGKHHRFTVSGKLVHNCGYGGAVGALKAMGALEAGMTEDELQPLVDSWRASNPNIVSFWWAVDRAVKECIKKRVQTETHGIRFSYESGMLFITLFSGRRLAYVKPRIGENRFGGESVTYMGVGGTKKWERLESYGPKFVENIVQAVSRDILCYAMRTLKNCAIVAHVHDEVIIEADRRMSLPAVCEQMGRTPPWAKGLLLRADGYECSFYQKD